MNIGCKNKGLILYCKARKLVNWGCGSDFGGVVGFGLFLDCANLAA